MGNEILHLAAVTAGLSILFVLPFIPVALTFYPNRQWPHIIVTSLLVGTCLQATTGLLWSHLVGTWPYGEIGVLAAIWAVLLYWCLKSVKKSRARILYDDIEPNRHYLLLAVILLIAFVIRSLHPLEVAYLGQSDAYTHLQYLKDIVERGTLSNPSYPPGYHWLLALPVLIFSIDPYWVARFSGALFGTALVLAVFVMMEQMFSRRAAYLASFIAACFPPMMLLMKTGVGSFANQFGLLLLPAIFLFYFSFVTGKKRNFASAPLLAAALTGLAAAVPMMLLHVLIIFAGERFLALGRLSKQWFLKTIGICLIVAIPLAVVLFHMNSVGPGQRVQTANTLIKYKEKIQPLSAQELVEFVKKTDTLDNGAAHKIIRYLTSSPYYGLFTDYFSIKRFGFGNSGLNLLGFVLLFVFLGSSLYGLLAGNLSFILLGLWGTITSVQAATGLLQFSSYQREGWSLLIATCCMSGVLGDWLLAVLPGYRLARGGLVILLGSAAVWTFTHPPRHGAIKTGAEDQLVRSTRFFGQTPEETTTECREEPVNYCAVAEFMRDDLPTTLITRRFTGWNNQGEITPNVLQRESNLQVMVADNVVTGDLLQPGNQYIVIIDRQGDSKTSQTMGAFAMVTPSMVKATLMLQEKLYEINARILDIIKDLPEDTWLVKDFQLAGNLTAYAIIPRNTKNE